MSRVTADIAQALAAIPSLGLTYNANIFAGPVRPPSDFVDTLAAFVLPEGGVEPEDYNGTGTAMARPSFFLQIRGDKHKYAAGEQFAENIRIALHHLEITGYDSVRSGTSSVLPLAPDEAGNPIWLCRGTAARME